uniref:Uncharacterized protein n=1 Tax=Anolis carolinensis TaxID=28377 RepID=A0A803TWE9_ANOCA
MSDSTWMSADQHLNSSLSPSQAEGMRSPQNIHSQEDGEARGCKGTKRPPSVEGKKGPLSSKTRRREGGLLNSLCLSGAENKDTGCVAPGKDLGMKSSRVMQQFKNMPT